MTLPPLRAITLMPLVSHEVGRSCHDARAGGYSCTTTHSRVVLGTQDAAPGKGVLEVVEGGFGELALGEVQGLERLDLGEVLQAGVGDRGGVEVQSFQRGEVGERLQPGVREAAAMGDAQLAQVAERAEMLQAGHRDRRWFHPGFCGIVQSSNLSPGTREKCLALLVKSNAFRVNVTLAIFRSFGPMLARRCFSSKNLMPAA